MCYRRGFVTPDALCGPCREMAGRGESEEMTCRELVEVVTDYLEDALPDDDRARLEAHLDECPYCVAYVAQVRKTVELLGELPPALIPMRTQAALLEAFRGWRSAGG